MSVTVTLSGIERLLSAHETQARQEEYAMRVAFVMRQYVPMDKGTLRDSEKSCSDYKKGRLMWNTPYAAKHYYVPMRHTAKGTTDHWDEPVRRHHMGELKEYVKAMYGRY